jgi:hypothetical protein
MTVTEYADLEQGESWRAIPGFEGYEVSNLGRVRSFRRHGGTGRGLVAVARVKKVHTGATGYLCVTLQKPDGNRCSKYAVHALVAAAFLGPRPDGMQVAHADGDRTNARLDNLRYATPTENAQDKHRHGTTIRGERGMNKVTELQVREIRARYQSGETQHLLAEEFNISSSQVSNICRSASWSHVKEDVA